MRECIYCGKQLEKGEKCTCAMSVAKRMEKEKSQQNGQQTQQNTSQNENLGKSDRQEEKEKRQQEKNAEKEKKQRERQARKQKFSNKFRNAASDVNKGAFVNVFRLIWEFIKSPVETILNPGMMNKAEIIIMTAIEGAIGGLCGYSVFTGTRRGALRFVGNVIGFKGTSGYTELFNWLLSAVSGAVCGILAFFLFTGILYFIDKNIFRRFSAYWDFSRRFALAAIPMTVIGAVGVILGMFSQITFIVLLVCGAAGTVTLIYEILNAQWRGKSSSKILYTMMAAICVFLIISMYIVRLAIL